MYNHNHQLQYFTCLSSPIPVSPSLCFRCIFCTALLLFSHFAYIQHIYFFASNARMHEMWYKKIVPWKRNNVPEYVGCNEKKLIHWFPNHLGNHWINQRFCLVIGLCHKTTMNVGIKSILAWMPSKTFHQLSETCLQHHSVPLCRFSDNCNYYRTGSFTFNLGSQPSHCYTPCYLVHWF